MLAQSNKSAELLRKNQRMTQVPTLGSISKSSHYFASVELSSAQLDKEKSVLTHQLDL